MSNIENIKILGDAAHESANYEQSYKYHSQILEEEIQNGTAWLKKGVSAAFLTETSGSQITEAKVLIHKAISLGVADELRATEAKTLKHAYIAFAQRLNNELTEKFKDYQKVSSPQGGSSLLHIAGQATNKMILMQSQSSAKMKAIQLLELICYLTPTKENYLYAVEAIDDLQTQSNKNGDYLKLSDSSGGGFYQQLDVKKSELIKAGGLSPRDPLTKSNEDDEGFPVGFALGVILIGVTFYLLLKHFFS